LENDDALGLKTPEVGMNAENAVFGICVLPFLGLYRPSENCAKAREGPLP
jgi:hypothetical protein